jgi:hypothetical protein
MLGAMRRHSKSFIIYLLFAMIIIVFVFTFNTGGTKGGGCNPAEDPVYAKVSGTTISRDNLEMAMGLLPTLLRTPGGAAFIMASGADMNALYRSDLEEMTPEQANAVMAILEMIYLASGEAERLGFSVAEKELARVMYPESFYKEEEVIGEDGISTNKKVFDQKAFDNWIVYGLKSSPQEYESFLNRILLAFKLQSFMGSIVKVEDVEAEIVARARGSKAEFSYVEFRPEMFELFATVTDDEKQTFSKDKEAEIAVYYDGNPTEFHAAAGYQLAGIFVAGRKADPAQRGKEEGEVLPTPEEMAKAKESVQIIRDRIEGKVDLFEGGKMPIHIDPSLGTINLTPEDMKQEVPTLPLERFKEVAKRESDHGESKARSGLILGWKADEDMAKPPFGDKVVEVLQGVAKDQIVGPVEVSNGYWLFFVQDLRAKKDVTLEDARLDIAGTLLKKEKGPELAKTRAEELLKVVQESEEKDLAAALEELKGALGEEMKEDSLSLALLQTRQTGKYHLATPGKALPGIGAYDELFDDSFVKSAGLLGKVYVHPDTQRAFVVSLGEREKPAEKLPEADLDTERENLSYSRSVPYFESWLKALRQAALEKGQMERTQEFNDYLAYLNGRQLEAEEKAARKAAE